MKAALLVVVALAACDPIWSANVRLRDVANQPVENATVAVACPSGSGRMAQTKRDGMAMVGSMGDRFPPGCDLYIAKPHYQTLRIRYRDLCPGGPSNCDQRVFWFDLLFGADDFADLPR